MPKPNAKAMEFLLSRRSYPAKTLTTPVPTKDQLMTILTAAARTPDHGKLEPWRFIVLNRAALARVANQMAEYGSQVGFDEEKIAKGRGQFDAGHLAVVVVQVPRSVEKIPMIEQTYSAGAVCLALLNAALASGWGANWITGWPAHDAGFAKLAYGLNDGETIAGVVYIGTETATPPDRPRPDLASVVTWIDK